MKLTGKLTLSLRPGPWLEQGMSIFCCVSGELASVDKKILAFAQEREPYVELEVLQLRHVWKQGLQQSQEVLLVNVAFHILADDVLDGARRHGVVG